MRIVVTGATGYLGSHFCRTVLAAGHEIIVCARRRTEVLTTLTSSIIVKDILSLTADDFPEGTDAIVHFATGTDGSKDHVIKVTVDGTRNMYAAAQTCGAKRFIHVNSISVYPGPVGKDSSRADGLALDPWPERRGLYAQSKILADAAIQQIAQSLSSSTMEVCIVRPGLVFGPDMKGVLDGTAVSLPLDLIGGIGKPTQSVPLLDIRDLSIGLLALIETEVSPGTLRIWNILSGEPPTKRQFLAEYTKLTGRGHRQIWVPRFAAMIGAYVLEVLFALRGRRRYLPYKVRRLYAFDARELSCSSFWQHLGINPKGSVRSCIESATTIDRYPNLLVSGAHAKVVRTAEALLGAACMDLPRNHTSTDIIIVGAGRVVSEMHVPTLKRIPGYRVRAVVDTNLELAKKVVAEFPKAEAYRSIDEIDKERWAKSTAVIATPGFTHFQIAQQLLDRGADLLLEKPVVLIRSEFEDLLNTARDSNKVITVFENYRLRANVIKLWKFLHEHDVGALVKARIVFHSGRIVREQARWSHDEKRNRVLVMELAIHFLDLVCLVAGELSNLKHVSLINGENADRTVSITGMAKSQLGAEVYFDLDLSGTSQHTQITLDFERCTCILGFFPESFWVLPERCNPIDDVAMASGRLLQFVSRKIFKNSHGVPKRVLPHFWIYRHHLLKLLGQQVQDAFSLEAVTPTMNSLFCLSEHVYPNYMTVCKEDPVGPPPAIIG